MLKTLFGKLVLVIVTIQTLFFLSLFVNLKSTLDDFIENEKKAESEKFQLLFNSSIAPDLFAQEYVSIQRFIEDVKHNNPEIVRIAVIDIDNREIASVGKLDEAVIKKFSISLQISGEIVGTANYFLSNNRLDRLLSSILISTALISSILLIVSILLILISTRFITKGLRYLHKASVELSEGKQPEYIENNSSDEIGALTSRFNDMIDAISNRTQELLRKEHELTVIIENIPSMLFVKDVKELRFLRFNKAGSR
ncbi:MAG: HAMP domain-containing protein [Gammaproteobacteria bacterium]|nr:HAMP domain-containing protein [Gammaproteobacteria bacterium]